MQSAPREAGVALVLVGFSPPERLAPIGRHLGWTGPVLGDQQRRLYHRLGIGRAPWWRVYTPKTLLIYGRHAGDIQRPPPGGEDTRQLGADAILVDGTVTVLWRPRSPDDRPAAAAVLAAAAAAAADR